MYVKFLLYAQAAQAFSMNHTRKMPSLYEENQDLKKSLKSSS